MAEICVCSHHGSIAELLNDEEFRGLAGREGFLVELRLDHYIDISAAALDAALDRFLPNVVVTFRHRDEGGMNPTVSDVERLLYLQHAASRNARYIDLEARTDRSVFRKGVSKLIVSYHDFEKVPTSDELLRRWNGMAGGPGDSPDVIKIAGFPKTIQESEPLLEMLMLAREKKTALIALGMGEAGFWTRVAGPLFGSPFTYSRAEGAAGTAPGQPTWRQLEELYRFRSIEPDWPVYGVIGNPIAHSLSPLMHNTALKAVNLNGVYLPFKVEGDPAEFLTAFTPLGLQGISITIPHKEGVQKICSEIDPVAESIGAVNTLARKGDGTWYATNTDAQAAADSLEKTTGTLKGKRVLILGAGGASRAVAFGVKSRGAEVSILNRTRERAESLANAVGASVVTYEELPSKKFDAVVNVTPLGMHPKVDGTPLEKDQIPQGSVVFDTVYNPLRTKLLNLAAERGCATVEGASMFIGQGIRQFELWTGAKAPREAMERCVLEALKRRGT